MSLFRRNILLNLTQFLKNNQCYKNITCTRCLTIGRNVPTPILSIKHVHESVRFKSKKQKSSKQQESELESDEDDDEAQGNFDDQLTDKQTKIMQVVVKSLRLDGLIKAGLGIARSKVDTLFYESKIRVNERKILKKSMSVNDGDVIDVIRGIHENNENLLNVARVEILNVTEKGENMTVKIRRCKSLIVDNYDKHLAQET